MSIPYPQRKLRLKKIAFFMDKPPFRYLNAHNILMSPRSNASQSNPDSFADRICGSYTLYYSIYTLSLMAHKEEYATHTQRQPWHTKSADEVLEILSANKIQGLTEEEAKKRIAQYGPNKLPESKPDSLFLVFLRQFQ